MQFKCKYFSPKQAGGKELADGSIAFQSELQTGPAGLHIYTERTILALNVALATRRPLIVSGEPGSGKSTLAANAAAAMGAWFYKQVITSRTRADDLLWRYDALQRLNHASSGTVRPDRAYVEPGALWWAFDPITAAQRGKAATAELAQFPSANPGTAPRGAASDSVVVLLDEIDKADPDVPNDLLDPLDVRRFIVRETGDEITAQRTILMILTTNGERELPGAFLRRCVTLELEPPDEGWFVNVADQKYGAKHHDLHLAVAKEVVMLRERAERQALRRPSTAEYLDALAACRELEVAPGSAVWGQAVEIVLSKYALESGEG